MNIMNDDDTYNAKNVVELASTDLVELTRQLCDVEGVNSVAEGDVDFSDEIPGFSISYITGDNEGDGNYMYAVIEFILDDSSLGFVRVGGTYSSWGDSEYCEDDITQVEPRQVVTTEYIAVDGSEDSRYERVLKKPGE